MNSEALSVGEKFAKTLWGALGRFLYEDLPRSSRRLFFDSFVKYFLEALV